MAAAAGLDPSQVIDLRGNHDVFDARRASASDAFARDSATAAALGPGGTAGRVRVTELPPRLVIRAEGATVEEREGDAAAEGGPCPAGVLVGVDATPDVRMHAFT
jgi:hypothetical protein